MKADETEYTKNILNVKPILGLGQFEVYNIEGPFT